MQPLPLPKIRPLQSAVRWRPGARQRAALVAPHQAGVADNVSGQDRRQFALLTGHGKVPRSLQRIVKGVRPVGNRVGDPCEAVYRACGTGRRT
jgi:hypothetical protein